MKNLRFNTDFLDSHIFKNSVITFGMCLSLFTITSFDSTSGDDQQSVNIDQQELQSATQICPSESTLVYDESKEENSQKTHHNFIASYLLEESSAKKETERTETDVKLFSQLLQLHKTIMAVAIGQL
jgi:hypothetical protein